MTDEQYKEKVMECVPIIELALGSQHGMVTQKYDSVSDALHTFIVKRLPNVIDKHDTNGAKFNTYLTRAVLNFIKLPSRKTSTKGMAQVDEGRTLEDNMPSKPTDIRLCVDKSLLHDYVAQLPELEARAVRIQYMLPPYTQHMMCKAKFKAFGHSNPTYYKHLRLGLERLHRLMA